jgi:carboxymethylenebutenolidase
MRFLLLLLPWTLVFTFGPAGSQGGKDDSISEERLQLQAGKDKMPARRFLPKGKGPFPAIVVIHGDFGLTTWAQEQARRLAGKGYAVLAVDLYRGQIAKDVEEAHILDRGLTESQVLLDLKAAVDHLASHAAVRKERLGVIGWDMGGGYALDCALHDRRIGAAVNCYGRLTTDPKQLAKLHAAVLGIFGEKDEGIPPETVKQFDKAMREAGKRVSGLHVYANCNTGFMDPGSPYLAGRPDAKAVADAWARIERFFATELKPSPGS